MPTVTITAKGYVSKSLRGGFRKGSGRKKTGLNSKVVRVPKELLTQVKEIIKNYSIVDEDIKISVGDFIDVNWYSYDTSEKYSTLKKVIKVGKTFVEIEGGRQFIKVNKYTYGTLITENQDDATYFWHIDWLEFEKNKK